MSTTDRPRRRSRLVRRLLVLQLATVLVTVGGLAALGVWGAHRLEVAAAGRLTAATASTLAVDPVVIETLSAGGDVASLSADLQPLAERVRVVSGTAFAVIMSPQGLRYSHAEPDRIGGYYVGTIAPAVAGSTVTETFPGTLGPSVRTVVPVISGGRVIGLVSVGVLQTRISDLALRYLPVILGVALVAAAIGAALAWQLARRLRRQTLGLEPEEITAAYTHHEAVLHAVGEGLLVLDAAGRVVVVNAEARRLLGLDREPEQDVVDDRAAAVPILGGAGRSADPSAMDPAVRAVLHRGRSVDLRDEPTLAGERVLLVNSRAAGPAAGPGTRVFTLRDRTELAGALRERDDARDRMQTLAGRTHEFANRMQTVLALMHLGDTAEATRAGTSALDRTRGPEAVVAEQVTDPVLAALLADKAAAATELGIDFTVTDDVDPVTLPGDRLPWGSDDLVSLVGNLVDNALEAVTARPPGSRAVDVALILDDGPPVRSVVFRVSDSGPGISAEIAADLFTYGFSTRGDHGGRERGIGLALVDRIARRLGGAVGVSRHDGGGCVFDVRLPLPAGHAGHAGHVGHADHVERAGHRNASG